jgi:hypothetical protein
MKETKKKYLIQLQLSVSNLCVNAISGKLVVELQQNYFAIIHSDIEQNCFGCKPNHGQRKQL